MKLVQQERPVATNHPVLGKIEFLVEVPQAESLEEATTMAGGTDALVAFFNSQVATNAKNAARAYARGADIPKETPEAEHAGLKAGIETKGQQLARDYSPSADTERGPSKAKKAAAFDNLKALVDSGTEFTLEQLQSILAAAK